MFRLLLLSPFFLFFSPSVALGSSPCGPGIVYCPQVEYEILPGDVLQPENTLRRIAELYSRMSRVKITPEQIIGWNDLKDQSLQPGTKLLLFYAPKGIDLPKKKKKKKKAETKRQKGAERATQAPMNFKKKRVRGLQNIYEPYPLAWVIRGFGKCAKGKREHPAIDIAGVGPKYGLGTPIRSMARARVESIHLPEHNPQRYGTRDRRDGIVRRLGTALPRSQNVPGYGKVYFFTRDLGSARTGVMLVTRVLDGPMKDHTIRYMHLGAIHPKLKVGSILKGGQELGVMGSTAILESVPHVHIDVTDPKSKRVNVAEILGVHIPIEPCRSSK